MDHEHASSLSNGATAFLQRFPILYHVSQAPVVDTISRYGLLSTTAILDLLRISGTKRDRLEQNRRAESEPLDGGAKGKFVLNDQSPLNLKGLSNCLVGMTTEEWVFELNRRVFLFPRRENVEGLADAVRARQRTKIVLQYRTADVLQLGEDTCSITSINVGYALRDPAQRGRDSFMPLSRYGEQPRPKVKEFCVLKCVPPNIPFSVVQ